MFNHSSVGGGPGFLSRCLIQLHWGWRLVQRNATKQQFRGRTHRASQGGKLRGSTLAVAGEKQAGWSSASAGTSHTQKNAEERETGCGEKDSTIGPASDGGQRGGRGGGVALPSFIQPAKGDRRRHVQLPSQPPSSRNHRSQRSPAGRRGPSPGRGSGSQSCSSLGAQWAPACGLHGVQMRKLNLSHCLSRASGGGGLNPCCQVGLLSLQAQCPGPSTTSQCGLRPHSHLILLRLMTTMASPSSGNRPLTIPPKFPGLT